MRFSLLLLIVLTVFNVTNYAQELQSKVTVVASRVPSSVDKKVFQTLQTQLTNFINNRKWTGDAFQPAEKLSAVFIEH